MATPEKIGTIELAQDLGFQRRTWKVQRAGWIVMLLLIVAAIVGLFGRGPASSAHLGSPETPLAADYERFVRLDAPETLTIYLRATALRADSTAEIWLDRSWLAGNDLRSITPAPDRASAGADRMIYTFRLDPSSLPARITYELESRSLGRIRGRMGLVSGPSWTFSQFGYP